MFLRKSLFSFGALEAQGCNFSGADGGIKIIKCSMTKGEQTANLYKMTESINIGDASAATKKEDTTRL